MKRERESERERERERAKARESESSRRRVGTNRTGEMVGGGSQLVSAYRTLWESKCLNVDRGPRSFDRERLVSNPDRNDRRPVSLSSLLIGKRSSSTGFFLPSRLAIRAATIIFRRPHLVINETLSRTSQDVIRVICVNDAGR